MDTETREKIRLFLDHHQALPFSLAAALWEELESQERRGERALAKRRRYLERRAQRNTVGSAHE